MKFNMALAFFVFYFSASVIGTQQSEQRNNQEHQIAERNGRGLNPDVHSIFLLKVKWPDIKEKEKILNRALIPLRAYARFEPRFFSVDDQTHERKVTGAWGVDVTDKTGKFMEEPHRLLGIGSVIPGKWLGDDTPGRNYEFVGGEGPLATRFKPTHKAEEYRFINFHHDGTCTEETIFPRAALSISSK